MILGVRIANRTPGAGIDANCRLTGCAVKGGGLQREYDPPGNWFAPVAIRAGSENRCLGLAGLRIRRFDPIAEAQAPTHEESCFAEGRLLPWGRLRQ
jgi:hypothetical protein